MTHTSSQHMHQYTGKTADCMQGQGCTRGAHVRSDVLQQRTREGMHNKYVSHAAHLSTGKLKAVHLDLQVWHKHTCR